MEVESEGRKKILRIGVEVITSDNSSAGRAEDCRVCMVILRSLVQFQLVGFFVCSTIFAYRYHSDRMYFLVLKVCSAVRNARVASLKLRLFISICTLNFKSRNNGQGIGSVTIEGSSLDAFGGVCAGNLSYGMNRSAYFSS